MIFDLVTVALAYVGGYRVGQLLCAFFIRRRRGIPAARFTVVCDYCEKHSPASRWLTVPTCWEVWHARSCEVRKKAQDRTRKLL